MIAVGDSSGKIKVLNWKTYEVLTDKFSYHSA